MVKKINSVGIDVGTTTLQVIFSELELVNSAAASQVPRYGFSRRTVVYVSPVVFTPRDAQGRIDGSEVFNFVNSQYEAAGLTVDDVESGAIIITGEASKAANARQTIMELADRLGDFVVATAGPHLESAIAGQGSGAAHYSRQHGSRVLNLDIGGGTSNYAVFSAGRLIDTACLNVGGHLIELDQDGEVTHLHEPALKVLDACFPMRPERLTAAHIQAVASRMAELIVQVIEGDVSELAHSLLMTPVLREQPPYDAIFISGGVGDCFYGKSTLASHDFYDIGPQLSAALHRHARLNTMPVLEPANTLRATVIGAGVHTLTLSGSTIWLGSTKLPLRNVPVLHGSEQPAISAGDLMLEWQASARMHDVVIDHDCYALAIPTELPVSYRSVLLCSDAVQSLIKVCSGNPHPLIVIAKQDFGKALGMELQPFIRDRDLAVIDEVQTRQWDYIDIGKGMFDNAVVPLTVKSLAFPS